MAKAVAEDSGEIMPVCAWVDGEYGISGVYLGVQAEIGAGGVKQRGGDSTSTESELAGAEGGRRGGPGQAGRRLQPLRVVPPSRGACPAGQGRSGGPETA